MPEAHSKYSASGFEAAMLCPGKPVAEHGRPDRPSIYAATGTVAHSVLESVLTTGRSAESHKGEVHEVDGFSIEVGDDIATAVTAAVRNIHDIVGGPGSMVLAEQRVNYSRFIGVPEADGWGTSDVIAVRGDELQVHDYKNGQGVVVSAEDNVQMQLYALGALEAVDETLGPFSTVRMVIHQPNAVNAPSEWTCTVDDLKQWAETVARPAVAARKAAEKTPAESNWESTYLRPGEKQCKFCRAKATCPALRAQAAETVLDYTPASPDEFVAAVAVAPSEAHIKPAEAEWLAAVMAKADLIEDWLKAVRAEVERRLLADLPVPGYKLVQGKRGNRKWSSETEAEEAMKAMRVKHDQMYDYKVISPTTAEKLAKAEVIGPRQWPKLKALIVQSDGKPSVAPASDPREPLKMTPVADDFEVAAENEFA